MLLKKVIRAGSWTVLAHLARQLLRLGGNLVLTRLLFPDAFGLMAIVQSVMVGLALVSDVGITPSIIQSKRGGEKAFLNTAWTLQIIRGCIIWLIILIAASPISTFYNQPQLATLLVVAGLSSVIGGFNSTKLASAERNIVIGRVSAIDLGSYVLGLAITVIWAWLSPSVWALVGGTLIGAAIKAMASHLLIAGERNELHLEGEAVRQVIGFGKWILLSSTLTYLVGEGNRLVMATLVSIETLAFFTLASGMNSLAGQVMQQVSGRVMFSAYAEILRNNPQKLNAALLKARLALIAPSWILAIGFVAFGEQLMNFLYDTRYAASGEMLRFLAAGTLAWCVWASYSGLLMATGKVQTLTVLLIIEFACQIAGVLVGARYLGERGMVIGFAASMWMAYPFFAYVYNRHGYWQPTMDIPFLLCGSGLVFFLI